MNIEQTIEAIRVMQAYVDGKEVELKNNHHLTNNLPLWVPAPNPVWNWIGDIKSFRIKPTATLRPWTADEVPLGMQARNAKYPKTRWLIDRTSSEENRMDWCKNYEYSIDGGKTWLPCGVVEECK